MNGQPTNLNLPEPSKKLKDYKMKAKKILKPNISDLPGKSLKPKKLNQNQPPLQPQLESQDDLQELILRLQNPQLTPQQRLRVFNTLLASVDALPFKDIITYDMDGTIKVQGKKLEMEQAILLKEGAAALKRNFAYQTITQQVLFEAIKYGVHSSLSVEMLLMSKAAIWLLEQEKKWIKELSQEIDID